MIYMESNRCLWNQSNLIRINKISLNLFDFYWILRFVWNLIYLLESYGFQANRHDVNEILRILMESIGFVYNLNDFNWISLIYLNGINWIFMESNWVSWNPLNLYGICRFFYIIKHIVNGIYRIYIESQRSL